MIISLLFIIPSKVGGAENYIYNLIDGFNNEGKTNFTLLVDLKYIDHFKKRFPNNNIISHKIIFQRRVDELLIFFLNKKLKSFKSYFSPNYITPFIPLWKKVKVFTTIHDIQFKFFPEYFNLLKRIWLNFNISRTLKRSYKTILISNTIKDQISLIYGVDEKKIKVIHNCVNIRKYKNVKKKKIILSVTAHYPHKNINILVKSFKKRHSKFKDYKLVIVGQFSKNLTSTKNNNYITGEDVILKGYIKQVEIENLFNSASLYFTTTLYEGFCMPVVESLMSGVPVLCSDLKILREVSENRANYIKYPKNIDCIVEDLNKSLDKISELKLVSKSNMYYFKQKYSIKNIALSYNKLFKL